MARALRLYQKAWWKGLRFFSVVLLGFLLSMVGGELFQQPVGAQTAGALSITVPQPDFAVGDRVTDPMELLDEAVEITLNRQLGDLATDFEMDVAVVTLPEQLPEAIARTTAAELQRDWGLGQADRTVLLMLVFADEPGAVIYSSQELSVELSEARLEQIVESEALPFFVQRRYGEGIERFFDAVRRPLYLEKYPPSQPWAWWNSVLARWARFRAALVSSFGESITALLLSPSPLIVLALLGATVALRSVLRRYWQMIQQPLGELGTAGRVMLLPWQEDWLYDSWLFLITWLASERYLRAVPEPPARSLPHMAVGEQSATPEPDSLLWHHYNQYLYSAFWGCVWIWTLPSFVFILFSSELQNWIRIPLYVSPTLLLLLWLLPVPALLWMTWETAQSYRLAVQQSKTDRQRNSNIACPFWAWLSVSLIVLSLGLLMATAALWWVFAACAWLDKITDQKQLKSFLHGYLAIALLVVTLPLLLLTGISLSGPLVAGLIVAIASTLRWRRRMSACVDEDWHCLQLPDQATAWAKLPAESVMSHLSDAQQMMQSLETMRYEIWQEQAFGEQSDSATIPNLKSKAVMQFEQPIDQRGIGTCPTCQARTLELYIDVQAPTRKQQGKEIAESYCLHCAYHDRQETELPRLKNGEFERSYRRIPQLPKAPGYSLSWPTAPLMEPDLG